MVNRNRCCRKNAEFNQPDFLYYKQKKPRRTSQIKIQEKNHKMLKIMHKQRTSFTLAFALTSKLLTPHRSRLPRYFTSIQKKSTKSIRLLRTYFTTIWSVSTFCMRYMCTFVVICFCTLNTKRYNF